MEYAVVKFTNETTDSDADVVSEVPASWLTKDNTHCKWPTEKFASVYIAKKFVPKDDWDEFPIEVECFCASLAEARGKIKKKDQEETGRGCRKMKPNDYFSPAEEEQRLIKSKKKIENKDSSKTCESASKFINSFKQQELDDTPKSPESRSGSTITNQHSIIEDNVLEDDNNDVLGDDNNDVLQDENFISHQVVSETDIQELATKIDKLCNMMAEFKLDLAELKENIPDLIKKKDSSSDDAQLSNPFPLTDLESLESFDFAIKNSEQDRNKFIKFLKAVGGHDSKDWTYRMMKAVMTDSLAEACSLTGRKNNYEIQHLKILELLYRVVNQKTSCTLKEFEVYVAEWLRHAHSRKIRKDKK